MVKFIEACLLCDVGEHDGSIVDEAASCDRTRLGIFDSGMRRAGGNSAVRGGRLFLAGILTVAADGDQQNQKQS